MWAHVTAEQLQQLRDPVACGGSGGLLRKIATAGEPGPLDPAQTGVLADLCGSALRQGEAWGFSDAQLSALLGLVKETHGRSVRGRLTVESSFRFFRDTLLAHGIHRPPLSVGVFGPDEVRLVLGWGLDTYFRHYKLYQVTLDVEARHPWELVEAPPVPPPLCEAATEEEHQLLLDEQQRKREAEEQAAAKAAAAAAEQAELLRLEEEYEASLPDDVRNRVQCTLERELARLRVEMEDEFARRHAALLARLQCCPGAAWLDPAGLRVVAGNTGTKTA